MIKKNNPLFDIATCWARISLLENIVINCTDVLRKSSLKKIEREFVQRIYVQSNSLLTTLSTLEDLLSQIKLSEKKNVRKRKGKE